MPEIEDPAQLDTSETLDTQSRVEDPLDTGYSPPDHYISPGPENETIEDRIREEIPDPNTAYGAPDNESGLDEEPVGGDDPDAIAPEDDWLGGEVGGERAGRLVSPDEGFGEDTEKDMVGEDVGIDGGAASAEEAAMHVVGGDELDRLDDDEDLGRDPDA